MYYCFSEPSILREKKIFRVQKKNIPKNVEKIPSRRVAQKRYNFAPDCNKRTFFLTHPIPINNKMPVLITVYQNSELYFTGC